MTVNGLSFHVLKLKFSGLLYVLGLKIAFPVVEVNSSKLELS